MPTSVLAVLGTTISISKAIVAVLQAYDEAPLEIKALGDEIVDLAFVLEQVRSRALDESSTSRLAILLANADTKLEDLQQFLLGLGFTSATSKWRRNLERVKWTEKKKKAQELKTELFKIKDNIVLLLCTAILCEVNKADANLNLLSQNLDTIDLRDERHCNEISTKMANYSDQFSELLQRLAPLQKVIEEQKSQRDMLKEINRALATSTPQIYTSPGNSNQISTHIQNSTPDFTTCDQWCSCICHRPRRIRSPYFLDSLCGIFSLGYSVVPFLTRACDHPACWRQPARLASLTYYFPKWLLGRAISIAILNKLEPTATLKMPRIIASNAEIFRLVVLGDIEGIKSLFKQRKASPNDIQQYDGTSVLQIALFLKMLEVSKLLLQAGADPYIVDYSGSTAMEYAQLQIHYNGCYETRHMIRIHWNSEELSQLAEQMPLDTSFTQERQFGRLHKAVLERNSESLRKELESSTKDIDMGDANGYTPLQWAAIHNDPECLRLLLIYGANPNIHDKDHCFPISEISWFGAKDESDMQKQDQCIQLLIQHGTYTHGAQFINKCFPKYWTPLEKACAANRYTAVVTLLTAQIHPDVTLRANALAICVWENSHECLEHILKEREQLKRMTTGAWWSFLEAVQCSADALTLRMLIDEEMTIKGLTPGEWEWLACLTGRPITKVTQQKSLYKEFIEGLRERAGFHPILDPLEWNLPDEETSYYNLDEDDDANIDHHIQLESESNQNSGHRNEDEMFEDAIEYHDE